MASSDENITVSHVGPMFCPWCGVKVTRKGIDQISIAVLTVTCGACQATTSIISIVEYLEPPDTKSVKSP